MKNNIILIGFMGCGKSSVGKELAQETGKIYLDSDEQIEKQENMSVSKIFETKKETYFRDLETKYLKELLEQNKKKTESPKGTVLSVGGGMPVREENCEILKQIGCVVYLKANEETIYERLKSDTTRPLLQGENPKQKIKSLMQMREEIYQNAAEFVIRVDDKSINDIVNEIKKAVLDK